MSRFLATLTGLLQTLEPPGGCRGIEHLLHRYLPAPPPLVLLPFLRGDYGEVLGAGEIELHYEKTTGAFYARHFEHRFPLKPSSYGEILQHCEHAELQALGQAFAALEQAPDARQQADSLRSALSRLSHTAQSWNAAPPR